MAGHSGVLIALAVGNICFFLINQILGLFNMLDTKKLFGFELYPTSVSMGTNRVYLEITPSADTFIIWAPIYIWHFVWIIYGLACMCRRTEEGPLYTNPVLLTPAFYTVSILNWALAIGWSFVSAYQLRWWAFVILALMFITTYICIGLTHRAVAVHYDALVKQGRKKEVWLVRGIVQNGLAVYATWCTIATNIQLATALSYDPYPQYDQSVSSTIALGILAAEFVLFIIMDWVVLEKHTRYTVTPYIVIIAALSGVIVENWDPTNRNSIFTAVLLSMACVAALVKFVLLLVRHFRDAKKQDEILPTTTKSYDMRL